MRPVGRIASLTCLGECFPGRVATSLLRSVSLPELVATSLEEYEEMACRIAVDAGYSRSLHARLAESRWRDPLFDADRFRRNIEAAYVRMWEIWQSGERSRSSSVDGRSDRGGGVGQSP
jgi:protein O-GlcNAc transferase